MSHFKRGAAALIAVMVVVSMATGGGMAAAPTYDTETTSTATTSDVVDGATFTNFNASSSAYTYTEISSDSNETKIEVVDNATGEVIETFTNSHVSFTTTNSTQGHYAWNISNQEMFGDVPVEANTNKTVDIVAYNNTAASSPATKEATITLAATNERTVVYAGNNFTSSNAFESMAKNRVAGLNVPLNLFGSEASVADIQQDNVKVDGSNTTVTYVLSDSNASSPFDSSASDVSAGDRMESQLNINGNAHALYAGSAPDDVDTNTTYGVYDSTSGEVTINVGDDYSDATSLDIHMLGNEDYGLWTQLTKFGFLSDAPGVGAGMLTLSVVAPVRIKRREIAA